MAASTGRRCRRVGAGVGLGGAKGGGGGWGGVGGGATGGGAGGGGPPKPPVTPAAAGGVGVVTGGGGSRPGGYRRCAGSQAGRSAAMPEAKIDRELMIPDGGFWPAPEVPQPNIYPMEWRVETEKLAAIYQKSKLMAWNPADLPWDKLRAEDFSTEQRLGIMYWFSVLANFDASGPAVFARATIRAFEQHEEDPVRKCFFSITRDEMNHENSSQQPIPTLYPS